MTSEAPVTDTARGTVSFARKVQVRPYETAEAAIYVQFDIPENDSEQLLANAKAAFFSAKALVFEELGLEFSVEEGGVIREVLAKTFGNVTEVASTPAPAADVPVDPSVPAKPPFDGRTKDKEERKANKDWAQQRYAVAPHEFFDNRPKKERGEYGSTSPDVKHKDSGVGLWFD